MRKVDSGIQAALAERRALLEDAAGRAQAYLALLDVAGSPATVATAGPRYFGFVNGGTLPMATAAAWLTAAWDQNTALAVMSPAAARLDDIALRWVAGA